MDQVKFLTKADIVSFLTELSPKIKGKCDAYLIGGSALTYWGKQNDTIGLDIIVADIDSLYSLLSCLLEEGFKVFKVFLEPNYYYKKNIDKPVSVIRDDILINIFHLRTTHFTLTNEVADRGQVLIKAGYSTIKIVSKEDLGYDIGKG